MSPDHVHLEWLRFAAALRKAVGGQQHLVRAADIQQVATVEDQQRDYGDRVTLIAGPTRGAEGSLVERVQRGGYAYIELPELIRHFGA